MYEPEWIAKRNTRGPREVGRNVHYDLCDGLDCPCFQEGGDVRASNHQEMVEWFAKHAPHMLIEALTDEGYEVTWLFRDDDASLER
jgi:hypothetical protein